MVQTRPATPAFGVIALVLLGGAIATAVGAIMMFARLYQTDVLEGFRHSTAYYLITCAFIGLFTAVGVMLTRPRGPLAPILATVSACVALYVGNRLGVIFHNVAFGGFPSGDFFAHIWKYTFDVEDLLAPAAAAVIAGLRVAMVAKTLAPSGGPYGPPHPGQPPV
ncbi:hypothetical protein E1281_31515, partial [Actinomadura sp. KC345]|uniref:hypothetical protein n=1 Tax=Actinomadura sp. KC345 TaxID=2530371 RepID=UPI00104C980F